jgi:predicted nucleic acid-binding protein
LVADHDLIAPDLARIEAANALLKKVRRRELSLGDALVAIASHSRYIEFLEVSDAYDDAIQLAAATGCSVYDGVYVISARSTDLPLVTADKRLRRTLGPTYHDQVLWLGDMPV